MPPTPPRRFNPWPIGIVAFFVLFISTTAGLIVFVSSQREDLVAPDYYEQEVRYQRQMERRDRTKALAGDIRVDHDDALRQLVITLPAEHAQRHPEGRIDLYRPSSAGLDRHVKLEVGPQGTQTLDAQALRPGLWKVRIQWTVGGQEFYADQSVVVPPRVS
jgi:nitrogen fixation protein FixH